MSEKQISETERKSKLVQISGKVTQETKDLFDELRESGAYDTFGQFIEALLEHHQNPIKINKGNEAEIKRLKETIEQLTSKIKEKESDNAAACDSLNEERDKYAKLKAEFDDLRREFNEQGAALEELRGIDNKYANDHKNCMLVEVREIDRRCLDWLAARENNSRGRNDITPESFFLYAVREMIIKGNKFAIPSMPNSEIARIENDIKNGR